MSFLTKINLKNNTVFCKELKVKHLKIIYKCLLGDEIDADVLFYNFNKIIKKLTNLKDNNLDFIDFFILIINLRCSSIGNVINIQISEDTTLELNLYKVLEEINKIDRHIILLSDSFNDVTVNYRLPTISEISHINEHQDKIYNYFIESIKIKGQKFIIDDPEQCEILLNHLSPKNTALIFKRISNIIQTFNDINLLNYNPEIKQQLFFNFNIKNLITLTKILYGDHLLSLYENIFALCKLGNFTPEYIENITPGEYTLLVKKLQEINKQQETPQQNTSHQDEPIDGFEESINPYESGDLPPITSEFIG